MILQGMIKIQLTYSQIILIVTSRKHHLRHVFYICVHTLPFFVGKITENNGTAQTITMKTLTEAVTSCDIIIFSSSTTVVG